MKKPGSFECKYCRKTLRYTYSLKRHIESVHQPTVRIKRENCVDEIVPLEGFTCGHCSKHFPRKDSLRIHITGVHLKDLPFACHHCDKKFQYRHDIERHVTIHLRQAERHCFTCVLCSESFPSVQFILLHFETVHKITLVTENYTFENKDEFDIWKRDVEKRDFCSYRRWACKKNKLDTRTIYACNRRGFYVPRVQARKRRPPKQGSMKINGYCPAQMTVCVPNDGGKWRVSFFRTHVGHDTNSKQLVYQRLSAEEKDIIANKIIAGIPVPMIIDQITVQERKCRTSDSLEKIDTITSKDIWNIAKSRNINHLLRRHPEDFISVEAYVQKNAESVLFYKRQGEYDYSGFNLEDDDLVLVIMTKAQIEKFKQYSAATVLIDRIHGVRETDFILHTVLVLDSYGDGYASCFLITNRNDQTVVEIMLSCIREKVGPVSPRIFMSDVQQTYFNAWQKIMGTLPEFCLFCSWLVLKDWNNNLSTISSSEKRKLVRQRMLKLLHENDVNLFHKQLNEFLKEDNEEDSELHEFMQYFNEDYACTYLCWANCYRQHVGVNTNMTLQNFHGIIKYKYAIRKKMNQIQQILYYLNLYLTDREKDEVIKSLPGGKVTYKVRALRAGHDKAKLHIDTCEVEGDSCGKSWKMKSLTNPDEKCYILKQEKESCEPECPMMCMDCQFCAHQFSCSCPEYSVKGNMCKHIHLLCMVVMQDIVELTEDTLIAELKDTKESVTIPLPKETVPMPQTILIPKEAPEEKEYDSENDVVIEMDMSEEEMSYTEDSAFDGIVTELPPLDIYEEEVSHTGELEHKVFEQSLSEGNLREQLKRKFDSLLAVKDDASLQHLDRVLEYILITPAKEKKT